MSTAQSQPAFRELLFSDLARYRPAARPSWLQLLARSVLLPGLLASLIIRAQQCAHRAGHLRLADLLHTIAVVTVGADVTPGARLGRGLYMPHPVGIVIGSGAVLGDHVTLASGVTIGSRSPDGRGPEEYAVVGNGAILSTHSVLLGGIHIGDDALVAAGAVVLEDVPANTVVAGTPARPVGTRAA